MIWDKAPYRGRKLLVLLALAFEVEADGWTTPIQDLIEELCVKSHASRGFVFAALEEAVRAGVLEHRAGRYRVATKPADGPVLRALRSAWPS